MDPTNINLQRYNLTDQVGVVDTEPKFNGNYSSVLLGSWKGQYVAIKVIKATNGQKASTVQRKLLREVVVWGSTSHPNIHPFYGVVNGEGFGPYGALISPWCQNGDAGQYLSKKGASMPMATRINLWKGVIEGVVYLHDQNPPIVHGDLKPGNVLIDDAGRPRICDFGLARIFDDVGGTGMTTTSDHTGTTRYLAPELVATDVSVPPTLASDVYALGCLGLQFIYLQIPFSNRSNDPRGIMILRDLSRRLPPAKPPARHVWPSHRIWQLISGLWSPNPSTRPSAFALAQMVTRTALTFPEHLIKKIIAFVDAEYNHGGRLYTNAWRARTRRLRNICLVSRAYCTWATPVLYRHLLLRHDAIASKIFPLNYALNHSITSPLTFNQVTDGYGVYTESLIMEARADELSPGPLATAFRDLLRMMPHLRLVLVKDEGFTFPESLPSLITLQMEYLNEPFVLSQSTIALAFSYLQRLSICTWNCRTPAPTLPAVSASVSLPHLRVIEMANYSSYFSSSQFLETFSYWKLPTLQRLDIKDTVGEFNVNSLIMFLKSHGSVILYLDLDQYGESAMPMGLLIDIFSLCVNLRSMRAHVEGWPPFDQLSPHPRLEDLHLSHWKHDDELADLAEFSLKILASFKHTAPTLFPKLRYARLHEKNSGFEAFFNSGDNFIMVENGNERYRRLDGGGIETDTSLDREGVNALVKAVQASLTMT